MPKRSCLIWIKVPDGSKTELRMYNYKKITAKLVTQGYPIRRANITSVDHKGVTYYGLRGRGVELCSPMTSVETRDLSGKADRFRVNSNTKRVGKSRHVDGGCLLLLRFSMKRTFDP